MSVLLLILLIVLGALSIWRLNRIIDGDGYGHRPVPRSHRDEPDPRPAAGLHKLA